MVGTQPGVEDTADPIQEDRLLPLAMLDSNGHTLASASSPPLASGKFLHPHRWCVALHNTGYSSAVATCCPNTWDG